MSAPTIVLQEVSTSEQEAGYRVILARGADVFGEWDEHVTETFVTKDDSLDEAVQELREELDGYDDEFSENGAEILDHDDFDDLQRAFEDYDTIKEAAKHFELGYGAVRQRMIDAGVYEPRTYQTRKEVNHPEADDTTKDLKNGEDEFSESDDCNHLSDYYIDGDCMRCNQAYNTDAERDTLRQVIDS